MAIISSENGVEEKVFCIHDYWDSTLLSGIANYQGKPYYFENVFDNEEDIYSNEYILTELTDDIFNLAKENWLYWLQWLKNCKEHPKEYAEKRKKHNFDELQNQYDEKEIIAAEKYYQNEILIDAYLKANSNKTRLKAQFKGDLRAMNTYVRWHS